MNFKSKILKLSIIIMLVLVLIPVVSAENSTETFFVEYDVVDEEVCVEEYSYETYIEENAPVETSKSPHEIEVVNEDSIEDESYNINESIQMNDDDVNVIIAEEISVFEPQDVVINEEGNTSDIDLLCSDFSEIDDDVNESSDDELTLDKESVDIYSVDIPDSKFVVMSDNFIYLDKMIFCSTFSYKTSGLESLMKNLDTKDDLLNDNGACVYYTINSAVIVEVNKRDFNEKHIGDFAYSIDNSIVGEDFVYFCNLANFSYFNDFSNKTLNLYAASDFDLLFDEFLSISNCNDNFLFEFLNCSNSNNNP